MDQYQTLPTMVPDVFSVLTSDKAFEKSTSVGSVPDHSEFTGKITVVSRTQGLKQIIVIALVKFGYMLENSKTFITDNVKIWRMLQWTISRKDYFGGLLDFSMVRVG